LFLYWLVDLRHSSPIPEDTNSKTTTVLHVASPQFDLEHGFLGIQFDWKWFLNLHLTNILSCYIPHPYLGIFIIQLNAVTHLFLVSVTVFHISTFPPTFIAIVRLLSHPCPLTSFVSHLNQLGTIFSYLLGITWSHTGTKLSNLSKLICRLTLYITQLFANGFSKIFIPFEIRKYNVKT